MTRRYVIGAPTTGLMRDRRPSRCGGRVDRRFRRGYGPMEKGAKQVERTLGVKEIVLAVRPDTPFEELVKQLKIVLTVPDLPGIKGCNPCNSGLDRIIVESGVLDRIR